MAREFPAPKLSLASGSKAPQHTLHRPAEQDKMLMSIRILEIVFDFQNSSNPHLLGSGLGLHLCRKMAIFRRTLIHIEYLEHTSCNCTGYCFG